MRKFKSLALVTFTALAISACSSSKDEVEQASADDLYGKAQAYLQDGSYTQAIRYLEATESRYPSGTYSEVAQLNLIYAQYKASNYNDSLLAAERFLRLHPNSAHLDYVLYMAGLVNSALGDNMIQDFFSVDRSSRETTSVKNAFGNFQTLVSNFPNSPYTPDALARMAYLKERLARHELHIVKFYAKRNAHVAVVNRVEDMLSKYSDSKSTYEALPYMKEAYEKLGLVDLANKTAQIIDANKDKQFAEVQKPEETQAPAPVAN